MRKIIEGDINISKLCLKELFDLSDVEVTKGDFFCDNNYLINLIGAPKIINGFFSCIGNNLTSLKGIPERIGDFYLSANLKDIFSEEYIRSLSDIRGDIVYW